MALHLFLVDLTIDLLTFDFYLFTIIDFLTR